MALAEAVAAWDRNKDKILSLPEVIASMKSSLKNMEDADNAPSKVCAAGDFDGIQGYLDEIHNAMEVAVKVGMLNEAITPNVPRFCRDVGGIKDSSPTI